MNLKQITTREKEQQEAFHKAVSGKAKAAPVVETADEETKAAFQEGDTVGASEEE